MKTEEIKALIEKALPGVKLKLVRESLLVENAADLPRVAKCLKEDPALKFDYLSSVTGADYLTYLESVYHLYSMEKKAGSIVLRARTDRANPRLPSLVPIYRGAEYQEREAYDLYGIVYENHPDMRRIFMWDSFEGWPMRKDYEQEDSETLEAADVEWLEKRGVKVSDADRAKAEELRKTGKRAVAQKPTGSPEA
ncbi:MAG TPA: NADH-quinone oxidoreductase subunit C [Verrucomicrobiae bacterium]|nr:NADH-quinone oxidoreductase subunit C [Verrucomicrobiae bacterium]